MKIYNQYNMRITPESWRGYAFKITIFNIIIVIFYRDYGCTI